MLFINPSVILITYRVRPSHLPAALFLFSLCHTVVTWNWPLATVEAQKWPSWAEKTSFILIFLVADSTAAFSFRLNTLLSL